MRKFFTLIVALIPAITAFSQCPNGTTPYYLQAADPSSLSNWNVNTLGTGATLSSFSNPNICYLFTYQTSSTFLGITTTTTYNVDGQQAGDWILGGSGAAIILTDNLDNNGFAIGWPAGTKIFMPDGTTMQLEATTSNSIPDFSGAQDLTGDITYSSADGADIEIELGSSSLDIGSLTILSTGSSSISMNYTGTSLNIGTLTVMGNTGTYLSGDFNTATVDIESCQLNISGSTGNTDMDLNGNFVVKTLNVGASHVTKLVGSTVFKVHGTWTSGNSSEDVFTADAPGTSVELDHDDVSFDYWLSVVPNIIGGTDVEYKVLKDIICDTEAVLHFAADANITFTTTQPILVEGIWNDNGLRFLGDFVLDSATNVEFDIPFMSDAGTITISDGAVLTTGWSAGGGTVNAMQIYGDFIQQNAFDDLFLNGSSTIEVMDGGMYFLDESTLQIPISSEFIVRHGGAFVQDEWSSSACLKLGTNLPSEITVEYNFGAATPNVYQYICAPVKDQSLNVSNSASYYYNDCTEGLANWTWTYGAMEAGRGYAVLEPAGLSSWTGIPNNDYFTEAYDPIVGEPETGNTESWTLVGNPYPSPILASEFLTDYDNSYGLMGAVYIWDQAASGATWGDFSSDDYVVVNGTGVSWAGGSFVDTVDASNYWIAPLQGFFVEGDPSANQDNVYFGNEMRLPSLANNYDYSLKSAVKKQKMWFAIRQNTDQASCLVGFIDSATTAWDKYYDAKPNISNMGLSTLVEDSLEAAIQGLPSFTGEEQLILRATLSGDGNYAITIPAQINMDNQEVWLIDPVYGAEHPLHQEDYLFVEASGLTHRDFIIVFKDPNAVTVLEKDKDNSFFGLENQNGKWRYSADAQVRLFDLSGKLMNSYMVKQNDPWTGTPRSEEVIVFMSDKKGHSFTAKMGM